MLLRGKCTGVIEDKYGHVQGYSIILEKNNKKMNLSTGFVRKGLRERRLDISNITFNPDGEIIVDLEDDKLEYVCINFSIMSTVLSMMNGNERTLRFKRSSDISRIIDEYKELKQRGRAYYSVQVLSRDLCIIREQCMSTANIFNKPKEEVQNICNDLAALGKPIYTITGKDIYYINGDSEIYILSSKPMYLFDDSPQGLFNGIEIEAIDFRNIVMEKSNITRESFSNANIKKILNFKK